MVKRREFIKGLSVSQLGAIGLALVGCKSSEISKTINPETVQLPIGKGVTIELVKVPAGTFLMGTPSHQVNQLTKEYHFQWASHEAPQRRVTIREFYIGKYPITNLQYQSVIGEEISQETRDYPVERVSWEQAKIFCQTLSQKTRKNIQLPSESQWEYAARCGRQGYYFYGDDPHRLEQYAWFSSNAMGKTQPVGLKQPNLLGLYDMYGNVWEWCGDDWHDNYLHAPLDDTAWVNESSSERKVIRGGSSQDIEWFCRSAFRDEYFARRVTNYISFRVVWVPT